MRLKGGGYLRGYSFRGTDLSSASWQERQWIADQVASIFGRFDSQWSIHVDSMRVASRSYPAQGYWPDRLTYLLDQDRRIRFEQEGAQYEGRYVLSLAYQPRNKRAKRLAGLLHEQSVR